ncbi:MAG: YiiG family protein [Pseudomonadota bacterium]|nr:YiiG family protein [Pseudomonadota bacterium]
MRTEIGNVCAALSADRQKAAPSTVRRACALAAVLTLTLGLGACGKSEPPAAVPVETAKPAIDATAGRTTPAMAPDVSGITKFNDYIDAYNKLVGTFGLRETYERYREAHFATAKPTASLNFNEGWVYQALAAFKKARADSGDGMKDLDKAADALIPPMEKLVAEMKELNLYYTSKAYREDNLAKGKQQDPILLADFEAVTARAGEFEVELSRVQHERAVAKLDELKQRGDALGYQSAAAMMSAETLANTFKRPEDVKNAALFQKADANIAELEKTLAAQRSEYEKAKAAAKGPGGGPSYEHESLARYLTEMIGAYRDFKLSKSSRDHQQMFTAYNNAVGAANSLRR